MMTIDDIPAARFRLICQGEFLWNPDLFAKLFGERNAEHFWRRYRERGFTAFLSSLDPENLHIIYSWLAVEAYKELEGGRE